MRETTTTELVAAPKVDPALVRQFFFSQTSLKFHPVTPEDLLEKPTTVIVAGNGLWMHRNLPFADMTFQLAKSDQFSMLPKLASTVEIHMPKLPWITLLEIIAFFREVNAKMKAEAYVQVLYAPSLNSWKVVVPEQEVTGGHVEHLGVRGDRLIDGVTWLHPWDIHSHNSMPPFFSGGDDKDEGRAHRFYGVIGKLDESLPKMKARISDGLGMFLEPALEALIDMPVSQTVEVDALSLLTDEPKFSLPMEGVTVPLDWMLALNPPKVVTAFAGEFGGEWDGWEGGRNIGYSSHYSGPRDGYFHGHYGSYRVNDKRRFAGLNPEPERKSEK